MPKLKSLKQPESLAKLAYEALLASILSGHLRVDEIYNEKALAMELGISRTPVHDALLELSAQGLVSFLPRKGVVVNRFEEQDIEEIFEIRRAIESVAVEKVAGLSPVPDLSEARLFLDNQRRAIVENDYPAFLKADRAFHLFFSELSRNRRLAAILENIRNMIELMGASALRLSDRDETVVVEHERILQAVEDGKPKEARRSMIDHLEKSEGAVKSAFR